MHLSRDLHAELLVANTVRAAFYGAPAACLLRIPFVWHRRDFWLGAAPPYVPWLDTAVKRCLCAAATRLISNSEATARRHPCQHKVAVIPNGIEIQRFDPLLDGAPFRQAHGIASDLPVVGTVGRLSPGKRQDLFVRILADVQKAVPDVWAVVTGGAIFGEDAYATKLRHLAEASGIARRLVLTGQLPDPVHALAAMDIFVQPGEPEAFGLVNIEAMAMAKPVVAFRHGALPEIVVDGETGILVAPGDEAAMAEAILRLLHDPELRTRMGKAGRARVEKHFTIERVAEQVSEVFSRTLERPSSRNR
jgi:glycosyltransferase involved in cell wall biosynthesis